MRKNQKKTMGIPKDHPLLEELYMKQIHTSDDAVVGIVVTILVIGLILAVVSILQTVYVPNWMEQREAEHMDEVLDQFAQLKLAIDTLSVTQQRGVPITTSVTLGSKELPFLMSNRAFGSLNILTDKCRITITNATGSYTYSLGTIKYSSSNTYYLDISYIYEAGGVIQSQHSGNIMSINPSFSVANETHLFFTIVHISSVLGKTSISGYGTYPIQIEFKSSNPLLVVEDVTSITIDTSYSTAWSIFFNNTLKNSPFQYSIREEADRVVLAFPTSYPNIEVRYVEIKAQISPGWVE